MPLQTFPQCLLLLGLTLCLADAQDYSVVNQKCGLSCTKPHNCLVAPCSVSSCDNFPTARCCDNYCGGCNAIWTLPNGRDITKFCKTRSCGPSCKDPVQCKVSPCSVSTCKNFPTAKCCDNYCGGCNAIWKLPNGRDVTKLCGDKACGPVCVNPVQCLVSPCAHKSCPAFPSAQCCDNYCGGCNAIWTLPNGVDVTKTCSKQLAKPCGPSCANPVQCLVAPCLNKTCRSHPTARCCDNYCGGCNAIWTLTNGTDVSRACNRRAPSY